MIRKIQSIHLYWFHACLKKLTCCLVQNMIKHYLRSQMSLNFESLIQNSSNPSGCSCTSSTQGYCHVMIMHHIVHCIDRVFFLCCRCLSPLSKRGSNDYSMTPMKNYTIFRSARQAQPPCSLRYKPTLSLLLSFTALGQERFICVNDHNVGTTSTEGEQHRQTKKKHDQCNAQYDA